MSDQRKSIHGTWSSRWTFILAATGSAVGLGNIWKFPYMAGDNGGGAFVLIYLACIFVIGIPIMLGEIMIGRRGRSSPANTMSFLAKEAESSQAWTLLGATGALAGLLILSFYSVAAGWAMAYVFGGFQETSAQAVSSEFDKFLADPAALLFWHTLFIILTVTIVARGILKGLEAWINTLMPMLFIIIILLCIYAMQTGAFLEGLAYLFKPDFTKINSDVLLAALGQAFFTLSLGMGAIMAYGAYMPADQNIGRTAITVAALDTGVALLAGIAIFPIVFANGLAPTEGPGLVFVTLPIAFANMPLGVLFGTLFFILLSIAALSSSISLIEPGVAWLVESLKTKRAYAAIGLGIFSWILGVFSALSFNLMSEFKLFGMNFFDFTDFLTNQIMLPLGGIFIAVFVGWVMKKKDVLDELQIEDGIIFKSWFFVIRFVAPVMVAMVLLYFFI
ncbi:MAG TPA: sodium-dependent transporter [Gammaproteobacteria bacterium]|nr:sodium-dependent transporter [Gammaproteobacteria bacterium]HIK72257.1 sodium-dependent transporter [Gammaproteobacteria bacterium]